MYIYISRRVVAFLFIFLHGTVLGNILTVAERAPVNGGSALIIRLIRGRNDDNRQSRHGILLQIPPQFACFHAQYIISFNRRKFI